MTRYWREFEEGTTMGPSVYLRAGMVSWVDSDEWAAKIRTRELLGGPAEIFCHRGEVDELILMLGHHAIPVGNPREAFWTLAMENFHKHGRGRQLGWRGDQATKAITLSGRKRLAPSLGGCSVASSARIGSHTTIDLGIFGEDTEVHEEVIVDKHVNVGHGSIVRARAEVLSHVTLCGWTDIGEDARICVGARILPHVKVGAGAIVGAGAVVRRDVPAGETWVGVPARCVSKKPERDHNDWEA